MNASRVSMTTEAPKHQEVLFIRGVGQELYRGNIYYWETPERNLKIFEDALESILEVVRKPDIAIEDISQLRSEYLRTSDQQWQYETQMRVSRNKAFAALFDDEKSSLYDVIQRRAAEREQAFEDARHTRHASVS